MTMLNTVVPLGWSVAATNVRHPRNGAIGDLFRYDDTGLYAHFVANVMRTVPQRWAAKVAENAATV